MAIKNYSESDMGSMAAYGKSMGVKSAIKKVTGGKRVQRKAMKTPIKSATRMPLVRKSGGSMPSRTDLMTAAKKLLTK